MKKIIFLAATLLNVLGLMAQSVNLANYYASANGKKKAALKTAMYNIIGSPDWQTYKSLWTHYYFTDRLPDNQVVDRYSNTKRYFSGNTGDQLSGMNKEHGIAQSWWGGGTNKQGSDLHHVMPSDSEANSRKSNYGMGIVTNVKWQNGSIKVGTGTAGSSSISLWEPADEWKGDFARAYFYIVTCYEELNLAQSEGAKSMQNNTYPKLQSWASQLYLKWAKEDPVSDLERARNEAVYQIQGNRNPFVDYQNLAEYIWGDSVDYAFDVNGGNNIEPTPQPEPEPEPEEIDTLLEHYYATVQGLKKAQLKTALHDIIQPAYVLSYGGKGEGYTWSGFARTDNLGNGHIRDRYSNIDRTFKGLQAVDGMNIEHIWANSWWGHVVNNAYCDLFNLFPADASANGRKSNNPIGVVDGAIAYDNGVTRVGKSSSYRADSLITAWEPADKWKGDFARTYFYMATAYEHMTTLWQTTEGLLTVDPSASWPLMRPWVYQLMLEWAENDPVDDIERARNDSVFAIQGNRNPYVDMPQLADYVWGDSTEFAFYINSQSIAPELFVPRSGSVIDFGLQSLQTEMNHKIVVRGRNLAGNLNVSLEDNSHSFSVSPATLTAAQVEAGAVITISRTATTAGPCTAALVLSDGNNLSHSVTLRMNVIDGIPAYDPASIVCNMNTKNFTACWKNMALAEDETYSLDVYTITNGERTSLSGYPVTTADTSYVVSGLKASTTYYYQVSAGSLTSNQVQVDMPAVKPVFSVSPNSVALTSQPGVPSRELRLSVTTLALSKYETSISCPAPFEVSADGENWSGELLLTTYNPSFYVRLGAVAAAGAYEGEMILTAPGVNELVVSLSAVVDEDKAFFENFESGTKGGYAEGSVTCNAATWTLANALLANDANAGGGRCVRMKIGGRLEMNEDKTEGCDSLSFYAGLYNKDTKPTLTVSYSLDGGQTWTPVVETLAFTNGEWKRYSYAIQQDGLIRLRFATQDGNENQRLNIDDIQMSNYKQSSSPDAISVIDADDVNSQIFMLDGRRVSKTASRGIYISGRKKFVK